MNEKSPFQLKIDGIIRDIAHEVCLKVEKDDTDGSAIVLIFDGVAADYIIKHDIKDQDTLSALAKAGTYIRYAGDDLIAAVRGAETYDPVAIVMDAMERKIEEDTVREEDEAEVERIMAETDDMISEVEEEIEESDEDECEEEEEIDEAEADCSDSCEAEEYAED